MVPDIARKIAAERLRRVIQGRTWTDERGKEHSEAGLGGGFQLLHPGRAAVRRAGAHPLGRTFGELARHLFFTETGLPMARPSEADSPFIGAHEGVSYFLLWNGTTAGVLDAAAFRDLAKHDGRKVVYAALCRVSDERLEKAGIVYNRSRTAFGRADHANPQTLPARDPGHAPRLFRLAQVFGARHAFISKADRPYHSVAQLPDLPYICLPV